MRTSNNAPITRQRLFEVLEYERSTGKFMRRHTVAQHRKGSVAGNVNGNGYVYIVVDGVRYLAHRLVWLWEYGEIPDSFIDHVDGNPRNNVVSNLRLCTQSENLQNTSTRVTNTSGHRGVSWSKAAGKWLAQIQVNKKYQYLGVYSSFAKACAAYNEAKARLHPACPAVLTRPSSKEVSLGLRAAKGDAP